MSRDKNAFNEAPQAWGPPPLTARPEGLLSSLGIQSGGEYPKTLLKELQPTYELGPWYREYNQTFRSGTVAVGAPMIPGTSFDLIQVPDGEIWILNRVYGSITCQSAAECIKYSIVRTNNANTTPLPVSLGSNMNEPSFAGTFARVEATPIGDLPIILRPTVKLRVNVLAVQNQNAAAHDLSWAIAILPCRI